MLRFREKLFQYRSYTPIPFLIATVIFADPNLISVLVGGVIAVPGELLRFWGVAYAGPLTRVTGGVGAPELIVSGPFAHVRNPLYVGNIMLYVGVGVLSNALMPWLVIVALIYFSFQYVLIVMLEEDFLENHFAEVYAEYRKAVPRFLPRLSAYASPGSGGQKPDWRGAFRSERRTLQAIVLTAALILVQGVWI